LYRALRQLKPVDTTIVTIRTIAVIRPYDYSPNKQTCAADTTVVTIDIDSQSPAKMLKRDAMQLWRQGETSRGQTMHQ
jgi:hypothetical protein